MNNRKVACFFAGVGGIDLGFEQTGAFEVVYANEIDKYPIATYENNFNIRVDCSDINTINASEIPRIWLDTITAIRFKSFKNN